LGAYTRPYTESHKLHPESTQAGLRWRRSTPICSAASGANNAAARRV